MAAPGRAETVRIGILNASSSVRVLSVLSSLLLLTPGARADDCAPTSGVRLYTSANGRHGFRMSVGANAQPRATGRLFAVDGASNDNPIWESQLVNVPARVLVGEDGRTVVTIDTDCKAGFEHSLVVYGAGGRVLADHRLEDLLTSDEVRERVTHSISSRRWADEASFAFSSQQLKIALPWGRHIFVDLATGRVVGRNQDDWAKMSPVPAGQSLKARSADPRQKQVVTLFKLDEMRRVHGNVFISGTGYVEVNGGGTFFSGMNRALDPYIELTITAPGSKAFQACTKILKKPYLVANAIAIGGNGFFAPMPGIGDRRLAVVRLDTISVCKLVPRR